MIPTDKSDDSCCYDCLVCISSQQGFHPSALLWHWAKSSYGDKQHQTKHPCSLNPQLVMWNSSLILCLSASYKLRVLENIEHTPPLVKQMSKKCVLSITITALWWFRIQFWIQFGWVNALAVTYCPSTALWRSNQPINTALWQSNQPINTALCWSNQPIKQSDLNFLPVLLLCLSGAGEWSELQHRTTRTHTHTHKQRESERNTHTRQPLY